MKVITGGVTAAKGFEAAAVAAEIKYKGRTDMSAAIKMCAKIRTVKMRIGTGRELVTAVFLCVENDAELCSRAFLGKIGKLVEIGFVLA